MENSISERAKDYAHLHLLNGYYDTGTEKAYEQGAADQRKIDIEKAVEFMNANWRKYIDTDADGMIRFAGFKLELKKYMEDL